MAGAVWSSLLAELTTWVLEMKKWKGKSASRSSWCCAVLARGSEGGAWSLQFREEAKLDGPSPARPLTRAALFAARVAARSSTRQAPNHCPSHHLLADAAFPERRGRRRSNDMGHTQSSQPDAPPRLCLCESLRYRPSPLSFRPTRLLVRSRMK